MSHDGCWKSDSPSHFPPGTARAPKIAFQVLSMQKRKSKSRDAKNPTRAKSISRQRRNPSANSAGNQAEEKLLRSEEQFRHLADNIREVFFIVSPDPPRMTYISPAYDEIWGRSREELYARPAAWIESVHPEDRGRVGESFGKSLQGFPTETEYRITRPDGSTRWINARSFPVRDAQGKFVRVVGIAENITARKEATDKLHAALAAMENQALSAAKLTDLLDILQSCQTAEEAYKVIGDSLPDNIVGAIWSAVPHQPFPQYRRSGSDLGRRAFHRENFSPRQLLGVAPRQDSSREGTAVVIAVCACIGRDCGQLSLRSACGAG